MTAREIVDFGEDGTESAGKINDNFEVLWDLTKPDYLFASKVVLQDNLGNPTSDHQVIPSGTWTAVEWEYMPTGNGFNTTQWTLNADGATFDMPGTKGANGIWSLSGTVAWEPWISGTTDLLEDHLRKIRWRYSSTGATDGVIGENGISFKRSAVNGATGWEAIECLQVYANGKFVDTNTAVGELVCEVWQNSGEDVRIVQYGSGATYMGTAPLAMCARLTDYTG